ncbi:MAG: hypothetical protein A6F71_06735 [Cycloclasticus sp. symbiont of Poecilosclerida sp. M]|nr:MAG: hypothetical protein A6F71_06735 [Cycloclasticus sp. symbiont of Poecilosclerida sp. M]
MLFSLAFTLFLFGCAAKIPDKKGGHLEYFKLEQVAKTDVDTVFDIHVKKTFEQLRLLAEKLYKRNPNAWRNAGLAHRDEALKRIFDRPKFPTVQGKSSVDSIRLAFDPDYHGDRVLAYIAGVGSMLNTSFNHTKDFYLFSTLDAQKIYNSARNIEIASWLLRTKRQESGELFLLSFSHQVGDPNQSYERIIGKIIGQQDTLAEIVATKSHRVIKYVLQSAARLMVFLPV